MSRVVLIAFLCLGASWAMRTTSTKPRAVTTQAPVVTTTKAPVVTTKAPVVTTKAPVITTRAPVVTTKAPVATTQAPVVTTQAPVVTTTAAFNPKAYAQAHIKGASGFFGNPGNAQEFYIGIRLDNGFLVSKQNCPKGTVWQQSVLTCKRAPVTSGLCAQEPAKSAGFYADPANCAAFFRCVHGTPVRQCCPAGLGFNAKSHVCQLTGCAVRPDCPVPKDVSTTTQGPPPPSCINGDWNYELDTKVKDGTSYVMTSTKNASISYTQICDAGTFDTHTCGCSWAKEPQPEDQKRCVMLDFAQTFNSPVAWVAHKGATLTNGEACLTGNGQLTIPFFNNAEFGDKLSAQLTYSGSGDATLIGNGCAGGVSSSVEVAVKSGEVQATLVTDKGTYSAKAPATTGQVTVIYDGTAKELTLIVGSATKKTAAEGHVMRRPCDLVVAKGLTGCVDNVKICPQYIPA